MDKPYDSQTESTPSQSNKRVRRRGILCIAGPPVFSVLLYFVLQAAMYVVAINSSAPNQGAMVIAFLLLVLGVLVSLAVMVIGIWMVAADLSRKDN